MDKANTCDICGNHYYRQFFNETVKKVSEGVSAHVPGMAPPLCRFFPILQGRQQCRGAVVMEVMAEHWTTYEVCELLSQSHREEVVSLSIALTFWLNVDDQFCLGRLVMWMEYVPKPDRDLCQQTSLEVFNTSLSASRAHYRAPTRWGSSGPHLVECLVTSRTEIPTTFLQLIPGLHSSQGMFSPHIQNLCNLCLLCSTFYPVTGHLWKESGFTFPVMPYRQWEAVTRPLLRCLLSKLRKICFAKWTEPRTSL